MKSFQEFINESKEEKKKEKEIPFDKAVDYSKRYPEVRELFTYAGNIQELDALKDRFDGEDFAEKKYDKEVIDFFYNERKKNLLYGNVSGKSNDLNDPDGLDMQGRAECKEYSKLIPTNRPNF